ncbi:glycine/betaine ABC transporter [Rhodoferax lacus]|uniref:Quaternary amine transport ATP-binding protein n=1 Tax=Rhodoferax lacus TaxID=2184758 RepID=A0A3E1R8K2_9BURK|nr:betaine/proline/choline family ABC transporter ATP-binding protein [Rhodoferax lacus]RFO95699.1 glycine/betaine ABC transporter [Rhodoferax lacus]
MSSSTDAQEVLIDCKSVWKVFGDKSHQAMKAIAERGLSKTEVLREFDCVVGVSNADIQVRKGEIFCIMGLSGSGKSTLIRLLNRLIEPSGGAIHIKGQNLMQLNAAELRAMRAKHIGMVFQAVALLPHRNVLENAAFGLEVQGVPKAERHRIATAALAKVGLSDWTHKMPRELSGGMQQRVGLARAIAADPEIILMDEPFSALDPLIRRQLQDEFRQLAKELGKSAVFITHDLDEAMRIGDRIAIMKDGVIVQTGTAADIVLNPANAYVAEFVAGISHLHLVTARSVLRPLAEFQKASPQVDVQALPRATPEADLDALIAIMVEAPDHAVAVWEGGALLGIVTSKALLKSVQEKPAQAAAEA